eukprot:CAMPEP_0179055758 /NCGR_PEP_ID=MMETSP0796-20121207/23466_1 /TAXON_ID=73915 /ORGANISM="Pyrodinium bahamense, Strain pbaha01" /LENGTH=371 /DNA_ID=CAMNT_0020752421 /DNA_START=52 /DNA_END=1167 /DNA_ORIENTATION=-
MGCGGCCQPGSDWAMALYTQPHPDGGRSAQVCAGATMDGGVSKAALLGALFHPEILETAFHKPSPPLYSPGALNAPPNLDLYIHGTGLLRRAVVLRAACAAEDGSGQGATQEGCQEEDSPRAGRGSSVARVPAVRVVGKIGAQGHCWVEGALVKASAGQGTARDGHADREAEVMVGRVVRSARGEHRAAERQGEEHLKSKARAPGPRELILEAEGLACRREGTEASEDRAEALDGRVVRGVRRRDLPAAGEEHGQSDRRVEEAPGHCAKGVDLNCQDQPDGNRRHAALPGNADADGEDQEKRAHKLCQQHLAQEGLPHNLPACTDDLTHPAVPGVHALITGMDVAAAAMTTQATDRLEELVSHRLRQNGLS